MALRGNSGHHRWVRLSQFILDHMEELLSEWELSARTLLPANKELNQSALRDDAENVLRAIAADMETAQSSAQQTLKSRGGHSGDRAVELSSHTHAHDRYGIGFDINQLVAEYRAVRASVIRLWTQRLGQADRSTLEELTRFNGAMDEMLADPESAARVAALPPDFAVGAHARF